MRRGHIAVDSPFLPHYFNQVEKARETRKYMYSKGLSSSRPIKIHDFGAMSREVY